MRYDQTASRLLGAGVIAGFVTLGAVVVGAGATSVEDQSIQVLDAVPLQYVAESPDRTDEKGLTFTSNGQVVEVTPALPPAPENQRDARRIICTVSIEPQMVKVEGANQIADPWTRLGSVGVVVPAQGGGEPQVVEVMRFITGFGGPSTFTSDMTVYAPLLRGDTTFRVEISTYTSPGWAVSMRLDYLDGKAGYRRPKSVVPLWNLDRLDAMSAKRSAQVTITRGSTMPRLHVVSSGHGGPQEFTTATHVLRIDGKEVARWRPWREDGGALHEQNPTSWRGPIDGRPLWSSDIDRAGWLPASMVEPLRIPLPELSPGKHTIELEILNIHAPSDPSSTAGYWILSANLVADEPWPVE